jgi:hypothetical protein
MHVVDVYRSVVQVQRGIGMVVVMDILAVHHQVLYFIATLGHSDGTQSRYRLPQKNSQEKKGVQAADHSRILDGFGRFAHPGEDRPATQASRKKSMPEVAHA